MVQAFTGDQLLNTTSPWLGLIHPTPAPCPVMQKSKFTVVLARGRSHPQPISRQGDAFQRKVLTHITLHGVSDAVNNPEVAHAIRA
jgi:hypothetical protein